MNSKAKDKVIFLDWNGTLSNSFFWEHMRTSQEGEIKNLYNIWDKALFNKSKKYIENWMRGDFTTEEVLKEIARETETQYDLILKEFIKGCKSMHFVSEEIPFIVGNLKRKGYYIVIATNNMDCFTRWTVPHMKLDELFDDILNSFYLKGLKHEVFNGEPIFFKDFFARYNISPNNCVFLDDSVDKEGYIESLGIKYIQIKNSKDLLEKLKAL